MTERGIPVLYYDYREWIAWPEQDIREYAQEIASHQCLTGNQAAYLEKRMVGRAGYWEMPIRVNLPRKIAAEEENFFRSSGKDDAYIFDTNRQINSPFDGDGFRFQSDWRIVGGGLTRRNERVIVRESKEFRRRRKSAARRKGRHPFSAMNPEILNRSESAMWAANCYPIASGDWLIPRGNDAPFEGLVWYSRECQRAYYNARDQSRLGNHEAAMWHAFRAGKLAAELEIRLSHGEMFDKYQSVNAAQRDAGRSHKRVSDEARREAYWSYRRQGDKRTEAGRKAAEDLNLSEASIRNAFPGSRYPD